MKTQAILTTILIISIAYSYALYNKNKSLQLEIAYANASNENLEKSIQLQNEQIKKMQIVSREPVKADLSFIQNPDETCQSELNAYKALFKELGR